MMIDDPNPHPSRTEQAYDRLRDKLQNVVPHADIRPSDRFDALIPPRERRQVWRWLRTQGLDLPGLQISGRTFLVSAFMVLAPVAGLYVALQSWMALHALPVLIFLTSKLARPWAIYPPHGCETIWEAALHLSPFSRQDYQAGLWPREDIADKVRLIVADMAGVPFESVTEETRLIDLFE